MTLLHGWDAIAKYLRVPNRKAQRLEAYGLPVSKTGLMVFSSTELLDCWVARACEHGMQIYPARGRRMIRKPRTTLNTREVLNKIHGRHPMDDGDTTTSSNPEPDDTDK